jgi:hypothetical protein
MQRLLGILAAAALLGGCAVSKDGVGFASRPPSANQIAKTHDQLQSNAGSAEDVQPGMLVIGTTGPLRKPSDKQREDFYTAYLKFAAEWHPGSPPALSAAAFQEKLAGWATIQTSGIPLIMSWRVPVLVSTTLPQDTRFASAAGSFMFGATGDLVAARSDRDGLVWMERVLCRDGGGFRECAKKYRAGIFDANTGQELARDRKPKADGGWVDVTSYVSLAKEPDRHTASELDPRALNRCDGCKGSLPASTQSVVPIP